MSAQTGKKGKKKAKAKTVSLNDFLGDTSTPGVVKQIDWADEVDEDFSPVSNSIAYQSTSAPKVITLPTAPRASRSVEIDQSRIPQNGPYTAFVGNLAYDVDEEVLQDFFKELAIVHVRLPEENGRFKGFGYVQFEDKQSLIKALEMNDTQLLRRNVRIDIADNQQNKDGGSWGRGDRSDRYGSGPDPTESNWRRASNDDHSDTRDFDKYGETPPLESHRYGHYSSDYGHSMHRQHQYGSGYNDRRYNNRRGSGRNDGYEGGGQYRKSSYSYDQPRGYDDRGYGSRRYDRQRSDDYDRSGYNRNRYDDGGYSRGYERRGYDRGAYERGTTAPEPPRERPQLNLKPREKPLNENTSNASERSSSIFGSAKPVDTATKEREIEEKLQRAPVERQASEKKSSSIFGNAKPVNTTARELEMEDKIAAQQKDIFEKAAAKPPPSQTRSSVFGDARPVDTASRERQIEDKLRRQEQQYVSQTSREESRPRRHSRKSSEQSEETYPASPKRRSRTSSTKSTDEIKESAGAPQEKASETRKSEFRPAPLPKENAWGRKTTSASDKHQVTQSTSYAAPREVQSKKIRSAPSPAANAWNRGPPKVDQLRGEREEAEGNSKDDDEEERTPEGAADEEAAMKKHRTEPGDGSEGGEQQSYVASARRDHRYKSDGSSDAYQDRRGGGGRYERRKNSSGDQYNKNRNNSDGNRRRGDGDSQSYQRDNRDQGSSNTQKDFRPNSGNRASAGGSSNSRSDCNEKKRDSSPDSRPECDRPDAAGQEQPTSGGKQPKGKSRAPPQAENEEPVKFASQSKFALLAIEDSGDEDNAVDY
ncbi:uncharacterized protein LOC143459759 isoform X1 [Clavelina lepadiformis]|uniref:uncharacterized protein LOC143459759 isoform X1 n=1 Tax=Clavelina lepadiformis TaxID=159417 RepID=UPI004041233D